MTSNRFENRIALLHHFLATAQGFGGPGCDRGLPVEREHLERDGYLVLEGLLEPARDLDPILEHYAAVLDGLARELHAGGRIDSTLAGMPFAERYVEIIERSGDVLVLHRLTCHASLPNRSRTVRASLDLRYHEAGRPSGRSVLPEFVVRSAAGAPAIDHAGWVAAWHAARESLSKARAVAAPSRWRGDVEACA